MKDLKSWVKGFGLLTLLGTIFPLQVFSQGLECASARNEVRVDAQLKGSDMLSITYAVINRSTDTLRWVRLGAANGQRTVLVPAQTPTIVGSPPGWSGTVVFPEETGFVHLWWEVVEASGGIPPGGSLGGFVVRVAGAHRVPQGQIGNDGKPVKPVDYRVLPFTVGGSTGSCWWGRVLVGGKKG